MMISGERTEQLDIFCHVTGFTSDFLSFIDVELIWFCHGALQLSLVHVLQCCPFLNTKIQKATKKLHITVKKPIPAFILTTLAAVSSGNRMGDVAKAKQCLLFAQHQSRQKACTNHLLNDTHWWILNYCLKLSNNGLYNIYAFISHK